MERVPGRVASLGEHFEGRLGIQQRVLPDYRAAFFDALARACSDGLELFAGLPGPGEAIVPAASLQQASWSLARNLQLGTPQSPVFLCWQIGLLRWLEDRQPDALVVEANPRYLGSRLAVDWMHARKKPVIGWGLGAPAPKGKLARFRTSGRTGFLKRFDALIAYSQRGAEQYRQLGFPSDRIFVAPNAAASRPAAPPPERPVFHNARLQVLFVGRIQARKRLDLLLKACAGLPGELQPGLTIVGDGPGLDDAQALARQVYPQAVFTGARRGVELDPYFAAADLFVLPGTGGLAVQQAMAHALPVVVAQGDGTQDDLVRPGNGWQVQPGDLNALDVALRQALSDPERLRQMGQESYRIVAEEINLEHMVKVFIRAVQSVLT